MTPPHRRALFPVALLSFRTSVGASAATAHPAPPVSRTDVVELSAEDGSGPVIGPGWRATASQFVANAVLGTFVDGPREAEVWVRSRTAGRWSDWVDAHARDGTVFAAASLSSRPFTTSQRVDLPGSRVSASDPTGQGFDLIGGVSGQSWSPWLRMPRVA